MGKTTHFGGDFSLYLGFFKMQPREHYSNHHFIKKKSKKGDFLDGHQMH